MSNIEPIWIVLLISLATLVINLLRYRQMDKRNPDYQQLNYLSKIKISEKKIVEIRDEIREDDLQDLLDEIFLSYNSNKFSFFKKLVKLLDDKWGNIIKSIKKSSNIKIPSNYFCDHYRDLIYRIIENKSNRDRDYLYPILNSFYKNTSKILNFEDIFDKRTYKEEAIFYSNIFSGIIRKSIEESNEAILNESFEMLVEQLDISIENFEDHEISLIYINNIRNIMESIYKNNCENLNFISIKLTHIGMKLASHKFFFSFDSLLNIFDSIIDFELESFKKNGKMNKQDKYYRLVNTEKGLINIWCYYQSEIPQKCSDKIILILKKINMEEFFISNSLLTACSKTLESLDDDIISKNVEIIRNKIND